MIQKCPKCGSAKFISEPIVDRCLDCGYEIDYLTTGPNDVAKQYILSKQETAALYNFYREDAGYDYLDY